MNRQTAADLLQEYARTDNQQSERSPPQTWNGGLLAAETLKASTPPPPPADKMEKKLTLDQMNAQLLASIQSSSGMLTRKIEELKEDIGLNCRICGGE